LLVCFKNLKGITAPFWFKDTLVNTVGHRESELALQLGKLYSAEEALKVKLVDELAEPKDVLLRAQEQMAIWCKIPGKFK
jgi:3,2-trans-enoyl-CoA isomerase